MRLYGEDEGIGLVTRSYSKVKSYAQKIATGQSLAVTGLHATLRRGEENTITSGDRTHVQRLSTSDSSGKEWYFGSDQDEVRSSLSSQDSTVASTLEPCSDDDNEDNPEEEQYESSLAELESWLDLHAPGTKGSTDYNVIILDHDSDTESPLKRQKISHRKQGINQESAVGNVVPVAATSSSLTPGTASSSESKVPAPGSDVPSTTATGTSAGTSDSDVPVPKSDVPSITIATTGTSVGTSDSDVPVQKYLMFPVVLLLEHQSEHQIVMFRFRNLMFPVVLLLEHQPEHQIVMFRYQNLMFPVVLLLEHQSEHLIVMFRYQNLMFPVILLLEHQSEHLTVMFRYQNLMFPVILLLEHQPGHLVVF